MARRRKRNRTDWRGVAVALVVIAMAIAAITAGHLIGLWLWLATFKG